MTPTCLLWQTARCAMRVMGSLIISPLQHIRSQPTLPHASFTVTLSSFFWPERKRKLLK